MNAPSVSIIILNWDGKALLDAYLPSVIKAAANYSNTKEIIVVDNGSTDDSVDFLKKKYPRIELVLLPKNLYFSGGNNAGVEHASGDIVILLNNDMRVGENFITPLVNGFLKHENVFAVSSQIFFQDEHKRREESGLTKAWFRNGWIFTGHVTDQAEIDKGDTHTPTFWVGGGSTAFDRKKYLEIKLDTLYDPVYCEDLDISFQAWKRGYKLLFAKYSKVYHLHRGTSRRKFGDDYIEAIRKRNTFLFIWKNITDPPLIRQHIFHLPHILFSSIKEEGIGELLIFFKALLRLPECMRKRRNAKKAYKKTDRDIFAIFSPPPPKKIYSIDFSFGDYEENLKGNWYPRELNYRWIGRKAICYLQSDNKSSILTVEGTNEIPDEILREKQFILSVYINNKLSVRHPLGKGELDIEYGMGETRGMLNEIRFELNHTFNPKTLGMGDDIRDLGVIINKVEIV